MSENKTPQKKEHKIVSAATGKQVTKKAASGGNVVLQATASGSSTGYRIGAIVLWIAAIGFEILALLAAFGKIDLLFIPTMWQMIGFLVLDLICLIIGSQLWKKANHIKPFSEKNKALFWLWNNLGLVVAVIAFVPFIILLATNKDADPKLKKVGAIVAVAALLIGGAASYDYNPVSKEQKDAATQVITSDVYWTNSLGGKVYHTSPDCQHFNKTEELVSGKVDAAIEANRSRLCKTCAHRDGLDFLLEDPVDPAKVQAYVEAHPVSENTENEPDNAGTEAPDEGSTEEIPENDTPSETPTEDAGEEAPAA